MNQSQHRDSPRAVSGTSVPLRHEELEEKLWTSKKDKVSRRSVEQNNFRVSGVVIAIFNMGFSQSTLPLVAYRSSSCSSCIFVVNSFFRINMEDRNAHLSDIANRNPRPARLRRVSQARRRFAGEIRRKIRRPRWQDRRARRGLETQTRGDLRVPKARARAARERITGIQYGHGTR